MDRMTSAFGVSFAVTALLGALLVVLKEVNHTVFQWMVGLTGHHWITHGVLEITLFFLLGVVLTTRPPVNSRLLAAYVVGGAVAGSAIIALFFLIR